MNNWSSPRGHVDQCRSSNIFSAPGWALHPLTALQKYHSFMSPCAGHLLPHCPDITPTPGPPWIPQHCSAHIRAQIQVGTVPCSSQMRVPGPALYLSMCIEVFSGYPFASVEKPSSALDLSVTKPVPTHYTFGIISCTGVHHTGSEELGSCGHLHNAWCASSSVVLLCSRTIERISGFNFLPFFLASPGLTSLSGGHHY